MTPEQYLALARRSGATVYTNRHYPLQPAVAFSHGAWLKFCALLSEPSDVPSLVTDPCPGCAPGISCRTPKCGRLSKINLAKAAQIDQTVTQAIKAWDEHEALTFHKLDQAKPKEQSVTWNYFVGIASALIKAADDAAADADYMLDSDDCIKVLRGEWTGFDKEQP